MRFSGGAHHWVTLLLGILGGCVTPWNTQLPTAYTNHPTIENQRYQQFDPFSRSDLGPDTMSRPPGYNDARSHPRQSQDSLMRQSPGVPGVPNPVTAPRGLRPTQNYPQAVPFN